MKKSCRFIFIMLQILLVLFFIGACTSAAQVTPTIPVEKEFVPPATSTKSLTRTPANTLTMTMEPPAVSSWRLLGTAENYIGALAVDPLTPGRLFAASHSAIYRSIYGGENWNKVYSYTTSDREDTINTIRINPDDPDMIYAAIYNHGVVKSTNGGETWTLVNNGLYNLKITTIEMDPSNTERIYAGSDAGLFVSANAGTTWKLVNDTLAPYRITAISIHPNNPDTLYAATNLNGLFKSDDAGTTWQAMNTGLYIQLNTDEEERITTIFDIAIDPANPQSVFLAAYGVFSTSDGGETWEAKNQGLLDSEGKPILAITIQFSPHLPNTLYVIEKYDNIFRSDDGGDNWASHSIGLHHPIGAIAFDPSDANILYVGTDQFGVYTTRQEHIPYPTETKTPYECSHGWTHLKVGGYAYVTGGADSAYNRVRYAPDLSSEQMARIYPGMVVSIIEGPQCNNGMVFWKVKHANIPHGGGWTAEGNFQDRWLESYP